MLTRKEFLGVMGVGVAVIAGCGSSDSAADANSSIGNCLANGTSVTIAANHGHVLVVSKDEVAAAVDKTYDIMGTATHTHGVTVTAANFATLSGNHSINVTTTTGNGHTHNITVVCA